MYFRFMTGNQGSQNINEIMWWNLKFFVISQCWVDLGGFKLVWLWFYNVMKLIDIFTEIGNAIQYNWDKFGKKDRILFNTFHAWSTLKRKMRHIKKGIGLNRGSIHYSTMKIIILPFFKKCQRIKSNMFKQDWKLIPIHNPEPRQLKL